MLQKKLLERSKDVIWKQLKQQHAKNLSLLLTAERYEPINKRLWTQWKQNQRSRKWKYCSRTHNGSESDQVGIRENSINEEAHTQAPWPPSRDFGFRKHASRDLQGRRDDGARAVASHSTNKKHRRWPNKLM